MPDPIDPLTPERAEFVAVALAEQWIRDWNLVMVELCRRTGLSRQEAMLYYALGAANRIAESLHAIQPRFHENCKACQEEKEFHEAQYEYMKQMKEYMKQVKQHLKDEHGPEDWQKP